MADHEPQGLRREIAKHSGESLAYDVLELDEQLHSPPSLQPTAVALERSLLLKLVRYSGSKWVVCDSIIRDPYF